MKTKALIYSSKNPYDYVRVVDQEKCTELLLKICNIPKGALTEIKNFSKVELEEKVIFIKEVNSSFYSIIFENKKYFIHERYIQKIKENNTNEL